jgi:hypothetical protein
MDLTIFILMPNPYKAVVLILECWSIEINLHENKLIVSTPHRSVNPMLGIVH